MKNMLIANHKKAVKKMKKEKMIVANQCTCSNCNCNCGRQAENIIAAIYVKETYASQFA
ncbi:MAG: hypothetical protein IJZ46_02360 [Bacilli bacterium]|nr:hypothetical protein [Bacilli bacterium]